MKRLVVLAAAAVQSVTLVRPLLFAVAFHRLPVELRDGAAARRSVEAAITETVAA